MNAFRAVASTALLLFVLACKAKGPVVSVTPMVVASPANDTGPRLPSYGGENEVTVYGNDPLTHTRSRIGNSQYLLRVYCESHGRYPSSLAEALPGSRAEWTVSYDFDGWGQPLIYRADDRSYELRSAGPDRQLNTVDDVIGTATVLQVPGQPLPTVPQPNPCAATMPH